MRFIYNILLLTGLFGLAPVWLPLVLCRGRYRRTVLGRVGCGMDKRLAGLDPSRPCFWVHALSVGEVRSAAPLVRALQQAVPHAQVVLSAATETGLAEAAKVGAEAVAPFPFDLPWLVSRFLDQVRPSAFFLVETDFWPNVLAAVQARRIPAYLVNGRISDRSLARYQRLGFLFRPLFASFAACVLQNEEDVERLAALGLDRQRLFAVGNLKYDAAPAKEPPAVDLPPGRYVIAGSTHTGEDELVLCCLDRWRASVPEIRLVIAPRHVERAGDIVALAKARGLVACRWPPPATGAFDVLVVDVFGKLAGLYQRAEVAFIGGSLVPRGGHNPIEAAVFGVPVLFGPHTEDFGDITRQFLAAGAAVQVGDSDELCAAVVALLADPAQRRRVGAAGLALVRRHQGAARRVLDIVFRGGPGATA